MTTDRIAAALASDLQSAIDKRLPQLLAEHPIDVYIESLGGDKPCSTYQARSAKNVALCQGITKQFGPEALESYHKLVIATLLSNHSHRCSQLDLPASIEAQGQHAVRRILADLQANRRGFYHFDNDLFVKDLAFCRLKLLACGPEWLDVCSGIPRRWLFQGSTAEIARRLRFVFTRLGGFKPVYETHLDRRMASEFSPGGYERCYQRIATLMRCNPEIRGVMLGATWFCDPYVGEVSPELNFLRELPMSYGAMLVPTPTDESVIADATRLSPRRMELYQSGAYTPRNFMLVWARDDLERFLAAQTV